jgi:hypothetical protein
MKPEVAQRRIEAFRKRFGEAHLYLAYHAAFPLALTPDLLYCLWANFQRDIHGEVLNMPWIAVADLLLSSLCDEVGHELYEMEGAVRNALLSQLKANPRFGTQRINELSDFLLAYIRQQLDSPDLDTRDFAQAQRWIALAYTKPTKAAQEFALRLSNLKREDKAEWVRMASLVETFAEPLAEFKPLLIYTRGMGHFARGDSERAAAQFRQLPRQRGQLDVTGVSLDIPLIEPQFDVLLVYYSQDKPQVRAIATELKRRGLKLWIDEEQLSPGRAFSDVLQSVILNVKSAAIFIGSGGLGNWQALELRTLISQGIEADIRLIPVLLPGVEKIPDHLLFLQTRKWVRFATGIDDIEALDNLEWGITGIPFLSNYRSLENLLAAGRWPEANEATRAIILKVAGQEKAGWLGDEHIQNFPCQVLGAIDQLWVKYSNGRFGLSVQKQILIECEQDPQSFGERLGWRDKNGWISSSRVIYNPTNAPEGHLPWGMLPVVTLDHTALIAVVKAMRQGLKVVAQGEWQRQLIVDFMAFAGSLLGDKLDKEEMKRNLEYELSYQEAWWEVQRIEEIKVRKLFSLLISCQQL